MPPSGHTAVLRRLRRLCGCYRWLVDGDLEISSRVDHLTPGHLIVVYAGSGCPIHGRIEEGTGTINDARTLRLSIVVGFW